MSLRLSLFGPFRAWRDGNPSSVRAKKGRALVAFLALPAGRPHHREQLASLLWGDTGQDRARHNLRQCLLTLRRELGDDALIVNEHERVRLDDERVETDVDCFCREAKAEGDIEALARASERYRGDLLEDLHINEDPYNTWLEAERARLRALAAEVRLKLARLLSEDQPERAIAVARHHLNLEPAHEETHHLLMKLYDRTGRRAAALRQFDACREAMERELDIGPGAATRELEADIRRRAAVEEVACARPPDPPPMPRTALPLPNRPSLAVLPLDSTEDESYFGEGIAEDITIALSKFGSLFVIARDSAFLYADKGLDPRQIGEELGVHFLVSGSVRRAGGRVRVSIQLVDAQSGTHVWAHRYDRELADIFAVQDEVVAEIVATLASRVEAARLATVQRRPTENLDAYDCVLRGKALHHRWTEADNKNAIAMFERAKEIDPHYALAYAWLGCTLGQTFYFTPDPELVPRAIALLRRAYELDDAESECFRVFASYEMMRGKLDDAMAAQERALELNPNDDRIVCQMGELLTWQGSPGKGERWIRSAMRLNPYHPRDFWFPLARALYHQQRHHEAVDALRRMTRLRSRARAYLVAAAARVGATEACRSEARLLLDAAPEFSSRGFVSALPYAQQKNRDELLNGLLAAELPP